MLRQWKNTGTAPVNVKEFALRGGAETEAAVEAEQFEEVREEKIVEEKEEEEVVAEGAEPKAEAPEAEAEPPAAAEKEQRDDFFDAEEFKEIDDLTSIADEIVQQVGAKRPLEEESGEPADEVGDEQTKKPKQGAPTNKMVVIQAESAGFKYFEGFAKISINDAAVEVARNESNHYRGLHVAIIEPASGQVEVAQVFDTYDSPDKFDEFIATHELQDGFIVVVACMDDCVTKLSQKAKDWFESLGSREIWNLEKKHGFAFIAVKGRGEANEKRAREEGEKVSVT